MGFMTLSKLCARLSCLPLERQGYELSKVSSSCCDSACNPHPASECS